MKKFLLLISSVLLTFGANAQVSKFEGASATVALAHQSYSWEGATTRTLSGNTYPVTTAASKGLVGKIGIGLYVASKRGKFLSYRF